MKYIDNSRRRVSSRRMGVSHTFHDVTILFISLSVHSKHAQQTFLYGTYGFERSIPREQQSRSFFLSSLLLLFLFSSSPGLDSWKSGVWDRDAPLADGQESRGGAYFLPTTDFLPIVPRMIIERSVRFTHVSLFSFFFIYIYKIHTRWKYRPRVPRVSFVCNGTLITNSVS